MCPSFGFKLQSEKDRHMRMFHRRQKPPNITDEKYTCSFESCKRVFNRQPSLSRHQNNEPHGKRHQPTQKSKVCKERRKSHFTIADSLRQRADRHDQDVCAAVECLIGKTESDKVRWVQCEDCELWFHITCIFLDNRSNAELDELYFLCFSCDK